MRRSLILFAASLSFPHPSRHASLHRGTQSLIGIGLAAAMAIGIVLSTLITRSITRPIKTLIDRLTSDAKELNAQSEELRKAVR